MTKSLNNNNILKGYLATLVSVAIPIILLNAIGLLLNIVDTVMVGRLGEVELAGVGAANQFYMIMIMAVFGFNSGALAFVSQFWGVHDTENIKRTVSVDLIASLIFGSVFCAIGFFFAPSIIEIFSRDSGVIESGSAYLRLACFTYIPAAVQQCLSINCRAIERLKGVTIISIVAISTNTLFNYLFIFGSFGMPRLGVRGAALATLLARMVEIIATLAIVYKDKRHPLRIGLKDILGCGREFALKVCKKALPITANEVGWSVCVALVFAAYGIMGPSAQAVVQVAEVVVNVFQSIYVGISNASAIMIGHRLGRGDMDMAYTYARLSMKLTWISNIIMTAAVFLMRGWIADFYQFPADTTELLISTLATYAFTLTPKMLGYVLICGIMRAGGDTLYTLIVDLGLNVVMQVPLAFIGVLIFHLPLPILVLVVTIPECIKVVLCYIRVLSKKWMNKLTNDEMPLIVDNH